MQRLFVALAGLAFSSLVAAQAVPNLPEDFRRALAVVPADSESLIATLKPFHLPKLSGDARNPPPFVEGLQWLAITANLDWHRKLPNLYGSLEGKEILWTIASKRGQEVRTMPGSRIIELGIHPYESVTIARFREPLSAEFLQALSTAAKSTRLVEGVAVIDLGKSTFVLVRDRDQLVTVTTLTSNESMLTDVVRRLANSDDQLFGSAATPWALVNIENSYWGIRKTLSGRGRGDDAKYRDWVLFSYDSGKPYSATFQSVLRDNGNVKEMLSHNYGANLGETIRKDMGAKLNVEARAGLLQVTVECLPDHRDRCLGLFFIYEAYGVMIWI